MDIKQIPPYVINVPIRDPRDPKHSVIFKINYDTQTKEILDFASQNVRGPLSITKDEIDKQIAEKVQNTRN